MTQFDRHRQKDEVPCTLNLQFMVRNEKLDMITYMRSQDVHKLLPHDLFIFTMIQEYQAALLQRDIGTYNHLSGSFHIYENELASIDAIINETTPSQGPMIAMPQDQANIHMLNTIKFENELRTDVLRSLSTPTIKIDFDYFHDGIDKMPEYWKQLSLMLVAYGCTKLKDIDQLKRISSKVKQPLKTFVDRELALLESGRGKLA
jgi:thymidylate synthase